MTPTRPDASAATEPISIDIAPDEDEFRRDVVAGLAGRPRTLPCKYFYDAEGSVIFDEICEAPEYYPTRTEVSILERVTPEIAAAIGPGAVVIEPGSGSGLKTELLLEGLEAPAAYVPVEIAREHLAASVERLKAQHPKITIEGVCADFTRPYELPEEIPPGRRVVFFPGSTIGNFPHGDAEVFLRAAAKLVGEGGGLLIGADLVKDRAMLEAAYDDEAGLSARFNLHLLERINDELGGDFDLSRWAHRAPWNEEHHRIEMRLESLAEQTVRLGAESFEFAKGETILTEFSHKHTVESFAELVGKAGFTHERVWTDPDELFSVHWCVVVDDPPSAAAS